MENPDYGTIASVILRSNSSDEVTCGICYISHLVKVIKFFEGSDSSHYDLLKVVLTQVDPDLCLVRSEDEKALKEVSKLLKSRNINFKIQESDINLSEDDIKKRISSYSSGGSIDGILNMREALSAFKYLDAFFRESDGEPPGSQYEMGIHEADDYLFLDERSIYALDIMSQNGNACLFDLLNRCRTSGGERFLKRCIRQPLKNAAKIRERLDAVDSFVSNTDLRMTLHKEMLPKLPDFESLAVRIQRKKCTLAQLYSIYAGITEVSKLVEEIQKISDDHPVLVSLCLTGLKVNLDKLKGYQAMIKSSFDFESLKVGEYFIKSSFDEDMEALKEQLDEIQEQMEDEADGVSRDLQLQKSLKLEWAQHQGHYLRVTLKSEISLRQKKGYIVLESSKSGIKFRTSGLSRLSQNYQEIKGQYDKRQQRILDEILDIAQGYSRFLSSLGRTLSKIDVFVAFAVAALSSPTPYVKPTILDPLSKRKICLLAARHPCMEVSNKISTYIPNDVTFDPDTSRFQILTGPNLGGKSTYMRSLAVNVVMAQIGCFVACDSAEISVVDKILVRIGAEDHQLEGISTFMSEMLETSNILRSATKNSLTIIDEIGRGTSTYDGVGVALAVADKMASDVKGFTIFATHFFEVTKLSSTHEGVKNFHMAAVVEEDKFTLLYKVLNGRSNRSFGIEVAKLCNFPQEIIVDAEKRLKNYEKYQSLSKLIDFEDQDFIELKSTFEDPTSDLESKSECLQRIIRTKDKNEEWKNLIKAIRS